MPVDWFVGDLLIFDRALTSGSTQDIRVHKLRHSPSLGRVRFLSRVSYEGEPVQADPVEDRTLIKVPQETTTSHPLTVESKEVKHRLLLFQGDWMGAKVREPRKTAEIASEPQVQLVLPT